MGQLLGCRIEKLYVTQCIGGENGIRYCTE